MIRVTKTYILDTVLRSQDEDSDVIICNGDTFIMEQSPNANQGAYRYLECGRYETGLGNWYRNYIWMGLKLPPEPQNAGQILSVKLRLYQDRFQGALGGALGLLRGVDAAFRPGHAQGYGRAGGASWENADGHTDWSEDKDANRKGEDLLYYVSSANAIGWVEFDLREALLKQNLNWESEFDIVIRPIESISGLEDINSWQEHRFYSMDSPDYDYTFYRPLSPRLVVEWEYVPPEEISKSGQDAFLTAEPYESDPTLVHLKWKQAEGMRIRTDTKGAYLLVRDTSPITSYTQGQLLYRSIDKLEVVDTGEYTGGAGLIDGQRYYYRVIVCDEHNYIDNTNLGTIFSSWVKGSPSWSNQVVIEKPKVDSFTIAGYSPNYDFDVWDKRSFKVVAEEPMLDNVTNVAYQFDWRGAGTAEGWIELEEAANEYAHDWRYTSYRPSTFQPTVRIRNSLGFYSRTDSPNGELDGTIRLYPIHPIPIMKISPLRISQGVGFRIRGDESYDPNADGEITRYRFQIRIYLAGQWWYYRPDIPVLHWTLAPYWVNKGTIPYIDLPGADVIWDGTYLCRLEVVGFTGTGRVSDWEGVVCSTETAVDIRTGLSSETKLTFYGTSGEAIVTKDTKLEGTSDIRIVEGIPSPEDRIEGLSRNVNLVTDVNQVWTWYVNQTLLKYYYNEPSNSGYITFRITGVDTRRRDLLRNTWSITIDVETRAA